MHRVAFLSAALSSVVAFADRPTSEDLQDAVDQSIKRYLEKHPPRTQEQEMKWIVEQIRFQELRMKRNPTTPEQRQRNAKALQNIASWRKRMAGVKRSYEPAPVPPRLERMDWQNLPVGAVGHVGPENRQGRIAVHQVLGEDRFLGEYRHIQSSIGVVGSGEVGRSQIVERSSTVQGGIVLFIGIKTEDLIEGKSSELEFDTVVTGRFTYETLTGTRTVPVLEKFDREDIASWK